MQADSSNEEAKRQYDNELAIFKKLKKLPQV